MVAGALPQRDTKELTEMDQTTVEALGGGTAGVPLAQSVRAHLRVVGIRALRLGIRALRLMDEAPALGMLRMRITMLLAEGTNHLRTKDILLLLINGMLVEGGKNLACNQIVSF